MTKDCNVNIFCKSGYKEIGVKLKYSDTSTITTSSYYDNTINITKIINLYMQQYGESNYVSGYSPDQSSKINNTAYIESRYAFYGPNYIIIHNTEWFEELISIIKFFSEWLKKLKL